MRVTNFDKKINRRERRGECCVVSRETEIGEEGGEGKNRWIDHDHFGIIASHSRFALIFNRDIRFRGRGRERRE